MTDQTKKPTNEDDDARVEALLLRRAVDIHPARVTVDELVRELNDVEADFAARDSVERAIGELSRMGLLHPVSDGFVTPTIAAIHFGKLLRYLA